jgi:hypothetical protein
VTGGQTVENWQRRWSGVFVEEIKRSTAVAGDWIIMARGFKADSLVNSMPTLTEWAVIWRTIPWLCCMSMEGLVGLSQRFQPSIISFLAVARREFGI